MKSIMKTAAFGIMALFALGASNALAQAEIRIPGFVFAPCMVPDGEKVVEVESDFQGYSMAFQEGENEGCHDALQRWIFQCDRFGADVPIGFDKYANICAPIFREQIALCEQHYEEYKPRCDSLIQTAEAEDEEVESDCFQPGPEDEDGWAEMNAPCEDDSDSGFVDVGPGETGEDTAQGEAPGSEAPAIEEEDVGLGPILDGPKCSESVTKDCFAKVENMMAEYADECYAFIPYRNATADSFTGRCDSGMITGRGTLTLSRGSLSVKIEGEFSRGSGRGSGTYTWEGGNRWEGGIDGNRLSGTGTHIWADGSKWEGGVPRSGTSGRYTNAEHGFTTKAEWRAKGLMYYYDDGLWTGFCSDEGAYEDCGHEAFQTWMDSNSFGNRDPAVLEKYGEDCYWAHC